MHVLAKELSLFNEITVYDTTQLYGEMGKFRCIQFADEAVQGAMDLKDTKRVMLQYQKVLIQVMELLNPSFEKVFVIGHGIGTIASHYPDKSIRVAEIDEKVVELSREFFGYDQENVIVGDGRVLLSQEQPHIYDYIILDAFNQKGTPLQFTTLDFFEMTTEKLKSGGAILLNLLGKMRNDRYINAVHTTMGEAYPYIRVFSLSAEHETEVRNMIIIGSHEAIEIQVRDNADLYEVELEQGHVIRS